MLNPKTKLIPTIGIETHVQLNTRTKLFSGIGNDAREATPNSLISHIDLGLPGSLPVLNAEALNKAALMAFGLNTKPNKLSYFERKHYFYPDLPKGYQITQLEQPIISGGFVAIDVFGKSKKVRINRVQIEEDAGKSTHPGKQEYSLVDLNRAGTPLLEIVSEADMNSAAEAKAFAKELYLIVRYLGISDADMYHGNMRFDVNVSVSQDSSVLGTRTETKNLNSFKSVEKAIQYEIKRQTELISKDRKITQETRGWDESKQKTFSQRTKEEAHDYRYFPEPDIPPIQLSEQDIKRIADSLPRLPSDWRVALSKFGLSGEQVDILLEAELIDSGISYLELIEKSKDDPHMTKTFANWLINTEIPLRRETNKVELQDNGLREDLYRNVYHLVNKGKLSSTNTKKLIIELLLSGEQVDNIEDYANQKGYIQQSDEDHIAEWVGQALNQNPRAAEDIERGEVKAIGFIVGQVMKHSKGKANPKLVQEYIKSRFKVNP